MSEYKCDNRLEGFAGCKNIAGVGLMSCTPCQREYDRRSRVNDVNMEINRKQLMKILDEYDGVAWKDLPKIIANFGTILGSHSVTGKAYKDRGRYLLLRQRNSSRGPVIVDQFGGMDTTHLTFINKQGNAYCWWTEISWISPFSLKGKEAADSLDYVSA